MRREVTLTGWDYASPYLDITAVYATSEWGNITVNITGTASAPTLTFTGDAYPSQDDVIAILLFGAPLSELDLTVGSQALMAAVMASLKGGVIGGDSLREERTGRMTGSCGTLFHNVLVSGRRVAAATVRGSPRA